MLFLDRADPNHFLCRMDARVKIISAFALLVLVLTYQGVIFPLLLAICGGVLCISMGVRMKTLFTRFSEPLFIVFVIMFLKTFFSGDHPLFSLNFYSIIVTVYRDGLMSGILIGCRIIGAVSVVAVLGFSTPFNQFMAGLSWMKVPRGFIEVSLFAHHYIFMLFDDASVIYNAQKNRLGYASVRRGLSSFGILAGSLVIKAFENSQSTAIAMTQRGYDGNMPVLEHQPFRLREVVLSMLFVVVMGFIWGI